MDVRMELSRVIITELGDQQVIFLREVDGERSFPIMIGTNEAVAIDRRLKGIETPRPMTHDLLSDVIAKLGARVKKIVISELRNHTFIATLHLVTASGTVEVDSRPSDAIAVGVASDTPIYVAEEVLETVLNPPASKNARLDLLRQRLDLLGDQISVLTERLSDDDFLAQMPEEVIDRHRQQLEEMRNEYDAIQRVLRKLG
jgi:bifunctional DNase/RNase